MMGFQTPHGEKARIVRTHKRRDRLAPGTSKRGKEIGIAAICTLAFVLSGVWLPAQAQSYPNKPIRLIVGFPPGGPNDLIARTLSTKLSELLKAAVVIENRPGSNGEIAAAVVAKATPDGYTLLFGSTGALAVSPSLQEKLPYDPRKDFSPIALVASNPMLLVVRQGLAANSVADLMALARANPGRLNYASAGAGSPTHLAGELFKSMAHVDVVHVPYKGGGPALVDLIAGQVDFYFGGLTTALPHVKSGKLRALGITSLRRSALAPAVPSIDEAGLPNYQATIWYGVLAPAKTPPQVIAQLESSSIQAVRAPDVRARLVEQGADPLEMRSEQFAKFIESEIVKWAAVVKATGATND
jgi:tripartite-type tricarboxylate transporter receptor subunit TctC